MTLFLIPVDQVSEIAENKYLYGTAVEKNKEIGICDGYKDYLYC